MIINCIICNKEKAFRPALIRKGFGKYCSTKCMGIGQLGRPTWNKGLKTGQAPWLGKKRPDLINSKASATMFKKGLVPWNKGLIGFQGGDKSHFYIHGKSHIPEMKSFYQRNREYRKRANGGNHTYMEWVALKEKYNFRCVFCGINEPFIKLTEDHIKPLVLGGRNDISNIQPLCVVCNSRKGAREVMSL